MDEEDEGSKFCEEDIDQILQRRTKTITIESEGKGSTFAKVMTFKIFQCICHSWSIDDINKINVPTYQYYCIITRSWPERKTRICHPFI